MKFSFEEHKTNQQYSNYIQPFNQNVFEIISSRTRDLNIDWPSAKVLDFGCNVGHLYTTALGQIRPENYTGLDVNKQALEFARLKYPDLRWLHYDKYNNTFNPNGSRSAQIPITETFDIVVSYGVFTHYFMSEIKNTIQNLKAFLKPGGILIFSAWEDVDYYGYLGFLDRNLGINVQLPKPANFKKGFVLLDRKRLLVDKEEPDADKYQWVESFYRAAYLTEALQGATRTNGCPSKHPVYFIKA